MAYPETRKERLAREQWMKNNSMAEEIPPTPIVENVEVQINPEND